MKVCSTLAVLAVIAVACQAARSSEPKPDQPVHLFTYPMGSTPDLISDVPCGEGFDCMAGFGCMSPNDEIHFYDFFNNNIKVIEPSTGMLVRLVPGPEGIGTGSHQYRLPYGLPEDVAVATDGTIILLLNDGGRQDAAYRFYRLSQGATTWDLVASVPKSALGIKPNSSGFYLLRTGLGGSVTVYNRESKKSIFFDTLLVQTAESRFSEIQDHSIPGLAGEDGFFYRQRILPGYSPGPHAEYSMDVYDEYGAVIRSTSLPGIHGYLVGVFADGTFAFVRAGNVAVTGPSGETLAVCEIASTPPDLRARKHIPGRGWILLSQTRRIYQLCVSARGLEVYRLIEGR